MTSAGMVASQPRRALRAVWIASTTIVFSLLGLAVPIASLGAVVGLGLASAELRHSHPTGVRALLVTSITLGALSILALLLASMAMSMTGTE